MRSWSLAIVIGLGLLGCRELGLGSATPREQYVGRLADAGLLESRMGREWLQAGERALVTPVSIELPYREIAWMPAERTMASGYGLSLQAGQRLVVHLAIESSGPGQVFLDLYRAAPGSAQPEPVVSADSGGLGLRYEVERTGNYILRVQPELLLAARFTLTARVAPVFGMPVDAATNEAIRSRFGAERDAGRRSHEGIDIFAPRGTPVLAATRGPIASVGVNRLGGNVIWQRDPERNQSLYYAHLEQQLVREGQMVRVGDTIGLVGNSGNARTTPTHLHFGIYRRGRGAVDPEPYVLRPPVRPAPVTADPSPLGELVRSREAG